MGKADTSIRIMLAIAIAGLGIYYESWWGLIALIPLLTAVTRFCPLYRIMGIKTCKNE
ncbi:MAG: DUF2892 domain-containing protein [Candidatus Kapaibacterium sp.]